MIEILITEDEKPISDLLRLSLTKAGYNCTCAEDGVGAIEVCGAFGKEWADKIIAATGNKVAVGYVVHNPEQDELFRQFFAKA